MPKVQRPPDVKYKDLESIVTSRMVRDQVKFSYRTDFLKVTSDTVLVPVTLQIPNQQLMFKNKDGVHSASLNIFGRVSTLTGRVFETFEDSVSRDFPDSLFAQSSKLSSIYQKALPLRPGLYRLDIVIKDVESGNVGVVNETLASAALRRRETGSKFTDSCRSNRTCSGETDRTRPVCVGLFESQAATRWFLRDYRQTGNLFAGLQPEARR